MALLTMALLTMALLTRLYLLLLYLLWPEGIALGPDGALYLLWLYSLWPSLLWLYLLWLYLLGTLYVVSFLLPYVVRYQPKTGQFLGSNSVPLPDPHPHPHPNPILAPSLLYP